MKLVYDQGEVLYSDNTLLTYIRGGAYFFSIYVTDTYASFTRYCVPGRIDTYAFDYLPGYTGVGSRVAFFTDTGVSLSSAVKLVRKDLKRKAVKQLLKEAKAKLGPRSYLTCLLEGLR